MNKLFFFPNRRLLRLCLVCTTAIIVLLPLAAQQRTPSYSYEDDYIFWGSPVAYLNYQAKTAYPLIDRMLQAYPPTTEPDKNRRLALVTLDQFLHDAEYNKRDAFYTFVNTRMARMLTEMNQPVLTGVRIYKLYDGGVILKTMTTTVAIDLVPGGTNQKPFLTDSVIYEIAFRCDALLITNADSRHANSNVAKAFLESGNKVIMPDGLFMNLTGDILPVGADTAQTVKLEAMTLHVLPGHNGRAKNNIYIMDFHGRGIVAHTGAQDNDADLDWIELLHNQYTIDVLLTRSQNIRLESMLTGFLPRLLITTGENEMASTVDKRESYWATQKRIKSLDDPVIPNIIMTWGETYHYTDFDSPNISSAANKMMMDGVLYIERKGSVYTTTGIKVK